jgi:hypothetical protein
MIEYAQWTAVLVSLFNGYLAFLDRKILKLFRNRSATNPSKGIRIDSLSPLFRWRLRRMRNRGFVLDSESNTCCFDEKLYKVQRKTRRVRVIILMLLAIIIVFSIVFIK